MSMLNYLVSNQGVKVLLNIFFKKQNIFTVSLKISNIISDHYHSEELIETRQETNTNNGINCKILITNT